VSVVVTGDQSLADFSDLPNTGGHIHLMGIAGAGMRGLGVLLQHAGFVVSGCDSAGTTGLADLVERGISVETGHDPTHIRTADLLVRSSAVSIDADEVVAAEKHEVAVMRRARALGALLNNRTLVGVAGTHGKTTITGMTGQAAESAGIDPVVLVGGYMPVWGGFARAGSGPAIVEADEYDRSFLELDPALAIVSSLESEHLDIYGDFEGVYRAFVEFAERSKDEMGLVYCADDEGACSLADTIGSGLSYGFAEDAWCRVERLGPASCQFIWPDGSIRVNLQVTGRHNQQNAAAAFTAALILGGDPAAIVHGLEMFTGAGRRLEILGTWGHLTVIDDYAHHPTEVRASLMALRDAFPDAHLHVIFQPHLFTRTRDFAGEFAVALGGADECWVLPIYPAREKPIGGVSEKLIVDLGGPSVAARNRESAERLSDSPLDSPMVLVFMGAGDVTTLAHGVAKRVAGNAMGE
jgi:UDP-N-acetylmuramate--alanine ligase